MCVFDNKGPKNPLGRSGNRCAICRRELVAVKTSDDDVEAIVGDEAHMAAKSPGGSRWGQLDPATDSDSYDNLILLCKVDHKVVDDQPRHYTMERLRQIKVAHENWVGQLLDDFEPPRGEALRVVIDRAEWSNFRHVALILEMRVSVENRTDTRKQLAAFQLLIHSGGHVADESEHLEVLREVEHRKQRRNSLDGMSVLEPGEPVTGWMVYAFPWKATPGEPEYTFTVIDELKNEYEAAKAYAGSAVGVR